jgi:hypothetical protein
MTDHDQLPLPDYDHLPLGAVGQRIRTLDRDGLSTLLDYERRHGNRLPVTELMQARLAELESGAEPSGGSPAGLAPEKGSAPATPRQTDQTTDAPTINPPSQGDPTNPAQPRR